jgi:hypothetical protein
MTKPLRCPCCAGTGIREWRGQSYDCDRCQVPALCERCDASLDPTEPSPSIPDIWADRYLALCPECSATGHRHQHRLEWDKHG